MIYLICIVGGMIIVPIMIYYSEGYADFLSVILGLLLGIVAALILTLACVIALEGSPTTVYEHSRTELIALNDSVGGGANGVFFLGTGTVGSDSKLKYRFIYREDDKGMIIGERDTTNVYLEYIDENETPCLIKYKERYNNRFWNWFLGAVSTWETFYVPEGSITNDIVIDLQ